MSVSRTIKWLHVSDFHFGKSAFQQSNSSEKLIHHISARKAEGFLPDFVFITGDVANSGKSAEYEIFFEKIIFPLLELFGSDFLGRIFVVPGNHDVDRSVNDGFSREKFSQADSPYFYPDGESLERRKMVVERFSAFCAGCGVAEARKFEEEDGAYTINRRVLSSSVGIVGLNTSWLCEGDDDKENLTPGIQLARTALERVTDTEFKFVLGHHPLSWIHPAHSGALQSIFAENRVIYLHGHMHVEGMATALNGAGGFVSIQAGAAWQAPEGSIWENGFIWGELDPEAKTIALQPFHWSFENQCWVLDGTKFHDNCRRADQWVFDIPQGVKKQDYTPRLKMQPINGWGVRDLQSLQMHTELLSEETAIAYFDGATPTWGIALSASIPKREIVFKLASAYTPESPSPVVCSLVAAGCEGKTTALLQASYEVIRANPEKKILYRTNHTKQFDGGELLQVLSDHDDWLIVVDEADQVAKEILRFIDAYFDGYPGRIDFMLASRDSDWRSSGASSLPWSFRSKYKEVTLKNLSARDADQIVKAWANFGSKGLGDELSRLPESERADKLRYYARKEAQGTTEAFFGALLVSRHGTDLLEHALSMLQRLAAVELQCGKTLKDVLGYIAAMHSEGFDKLTFAALASLMQMPVTKLQNEVIRQLGKEAAATSTSTSIFTRHRYIAMAIVEVLENNFDDDVSHYFIDLAVSEVLRSKDEHVMDLAFWRFDLAESLFVSGKTRLAIQIAERLYESDSSDYHLLTKLASFYRKQGSGSEAIALFRRFDNRPDNRGFYFEWGVGEGTQKNYVENALLVAFSLSDDVDPNSLTVDQSTKFLTGLSKCCDQLHVAFADPIFREAEAASNSLLNSLNPRSISVSSKGTDQLDIFMRDVAKNRRRIYGILDAIKMIKGMVKELGGYGIARDVAQGIDINLMAFGHLERIVRNVEKNIRH